MNRFESEIFDNFLKWRKLHFLAPIWTFVYIFFLYFRERSSRGESGEKLFSTGTNNIFKKYQRPRAGSFTSSLLMRRIILELRIIISGSWLNLAKSGPEWFCPEIAGWRTDGLLSLAFHFSRVELFMIHNFFLPKMTIYSVAFLNIPWKGTWISGLISCYNM